MKKKIFAAFCTMITAGFFGCAAKPAVTVTDENNGSSVTVKTGKIVEIKLLGQIGTGFSWQWTVNDEFFALDKAPVTVPFDEDKDLVGGRDYTVFRLKAQKAGETELHFTYARHWEKKPPVKQYSVKAVVVE